MKSPNLSFQFSRPFSKDCPNQIHICTHDGHLIFIDFCGLIYRNNPEVLKSDWEIIQKKLIGHKLKNGLQVLNLRHSTTDISSGENYTLSNYGLGGGHIKALKETGRPWIDSFYAKEPIPVDKAEVEAASLLHGPIENAKEFLRKEGLDPDKIGEEGDAYAKALLDLRKRLMRLKECCNSISQTQFITEAILEKLERDKCIGCDSETGPQPDCPVCGT